MGDGSSSSTTERRTIAEDVYRSLKRDIITLQRRPGASVTEQELAQAYGSSRIPVREACRRLQQEGLLASIPYKGYFVPQISIKDINDCFDLRLALETHRLDRAVKRATPEDLKRLEELSITEYKFNDWASYGDFLEGNQEFHVQLTALCGNERLIGVVHDLLSTMQRFFFLGLDLGNYAAEMRDEHEDLVGLLRKGDADGLEECVRGQIKASRARVLRALVDQEIDLPLE
jgi:DNA-binding GntR family transcriptional regulator